MALRSLFALVALACLATTPAGADHKPGPPPDAATMAALKKGGYVVYLRHAETEPRPDADNMYFADCTTQRNLDDVGRRAAKAIGDGFKRLGIPVGRVLASPFCRTHETAQIAFGKAETAQDLVSRGKTTDPAEQARLPAVRRLLAARPAPGTNTVLVGHSGPMDAAAGIHLDEGELAIVEPAGGESFRFVARIRPEHWPSIVTKR